MVVELAKTAPFGVALKTCGKSASRSDVRRHPRSATAEHRSPRSRAVSRPCTTPQAPERTVHRYYDPTTGQFLSVDPLVASTGQPYQYAGNNPVNASDPSGLDSAGCTGAPPGLSGMWGSCIGLRGPGDMIYEIKTSTYVDQSGCSVAQLLINGKVYYQAPRVCYVVGEDEPGSEGNPGPLIVFDGRHLHADWSRSALQSFVRPGGGPLREEPFRPGDKVCERYVGSFGTSDQACESIGTPDVWHGQRPSPPTFPSPPPYNYQPPRINISPSAPPAQTTSWTSTGGSCSDPSYTANLESA